MHIVHQGEGFAHGSLSRNVRQRRHPKPLHSLPQLRSMGMASVEYERIRCKINIPLDGGCVKQYI
jgi:hypothetical protein